MKKSIFLCVVFFAILMNSGAQNMGALASCIGLIDQLKWAVDIDEEQAAVGAGALFKMAKGNMDDTDFKKIAEIVPDMNGLLNAVHDIGGQNKSLRLTTSKSVIDMSQVVLVFEELGIDKDKVSLFTPVLVCWVKRKGDNHLGEVLKEALKY